MAARQREIAHAISAHSPLRRSPVRRKKCVRQDTDLVRRFKPIGAVQPRAQKYLYLRKSEIMHYSRILLQEEQLC